MLRQCRDQRKSDIAYPCVIKLLRLLVPLFRFFVLWRCQISCGIPYMACLIDVWICMTQRLAISLLLKPLRGSIWQVLGICKCQSIKGHK